MLERVVAIGVCAVLLGCTVQPEPRVRPPTAKSEPPEWEVRKDRFLAGWDSVNSLAASGPDDIWAKVFWGQAPEGAYGTGLAHWNGRTWQVQKDSPVDGVLEAISPTDAWSIGDDAAHHWDGKRWSKVEDPMPGGHYRAVDALSGNDMWVVGSTGSDQNSRAGTVHWDGRTWKRIAVPADDRSSLDAVEAVAADDVWAVGSRSHADEGPSKPLVLHWNGRRWSDVELPKLPGEAGLTEIVQAGTAPRTVPPTLCWP